MPSPVLVTAATEDPVSLAEIKMHSRVDTIDEDLLLTNLLGAAVADFEAHTGRVLVSSTWDYYIDKFPQGDSIGIPAGPVTSVTSVKYIDSAEATTTVSSALYYLDPASSQGRVMLKYNQSWPTATLRPSSGVVVRYVAGYSGAATVPAAIKAALLLMVDHLYTNRSAVTVGTAGVTYSKELEMGLRRLASPFVLASALGFC